jgi:tetrahydromethanopterin S-methyltransferase subunit B
VEDTITRAEHEEFSKRLEEWDKRQDRRIELLEESVRDMSALTTSVEKLATNIEGMVKEQEKQGKRLEVLESRDGEMWRKVVGYIITAVVGIIIGFIFTQFGM